MAEYFKPLCLPIACVCRIVAVYPLYWMPAAAGASPTSAHVITEEICHEDPLLDCGRIADFADRFLMFVQE
jgi:hypothetical protein